MTTQDISRKMVDYCRKGEFDAAHEDLYDKNAISIEPEASAGFPKETKGLSAIREKGKKWDKMLEKKGSCIISEPILAKNSFAFHLTMDVTTKDRGQMVIEELCVYSVKDGKIVQEQFFM